MTSLRRTPEGDAGRAPLAKMTLEDTRPLDNGALWLRYSLQNQ
jgi:hypothetical protein